MNNNKLSHALYILSLALLTVLTTSISFMSINLDNVDFFTTFLYGYKVPCFIIFCSLFLFVILYSLTLLFYKYKFDRNKFFPYIILFLIFILQSIFIIKMKASLRYDTLKVFDEAISLLDGGTISPTYSSGYFAKYPINIPMCITTCLLLKLPKLFSLDCNYYMLFVQLINAFMIDIALFFSFQFIKQVKNQKIGILFLIICFFNPLTYLIAPFYYTHTFSMAFSTGAIYFFVCCIQESNNGKKRLLYAFLTGLLIVVGFKIRATVSIIPIAILIYLLLNLKRLSKKSIYPFMSFMIAIFLGFTGYHLIEKQYVNFDYSDSGYPATHWIMLGLQGTGGYNAADDAYTECFVTKSEKTKATEEVIAQRINNLGINGLIKLWKKKLAITWSDGTDDFIDNISMTTNYGIKNDLISGSNNDILVTYCYVYHFMIFLLLIISIISLLYKKPNNFLYIVALNLLGGIIFHLFWEAGEVYSISFSCSILVLAADGFHICFQHFNSIKKPKIRALILASSTAMATFCIIYVGSKLTTIPYTHYEYAMKQDLAEPDTNQPLLENTVLCQTFTTQRAFNTIGIKVRNTLGNDNCSAYKFELLNSNNDILYESDIIGSWAFDKDYYLIEFNTITPTENKEYTIKILPNIVSDVHFLTFQSYNTGNFDIYPNGCLFENDKATTGDLTFIVYNKIDQPFFNN
ncbi:MAG: hypothetical protein ACERKZ_10315 [Lachnotalea sp.]